MQTNIIDFIYFLYKQKNTFVKTVHLSNMLRQKKEKKKAFKRKQMGK